MIKLGISPKEFREQFFESKPFLTRGSFFPNFNWDEVNQAIYISESSPLGIRVHKNGFVPEDQYLEQCIEVGVLKKKIIKSALHQLLGEGATIIFNRMESLSLPIRNICNEISRFLGEDVKANGYIAFGEKESFGAHWDTHDVFAVQLIGKKRWKVFNPTFELPLAKQTSKLYKDECPSDPVLDIILEAGDILYIPRGWWHTAIPMNQETFHIAIGSHPLTVVDYIKWVAEKVLPDIFECRRSLNFSGDENAVVMEASQKIFQAITSDLNFKKFHNKNLLEERVATGFDIARCMNPTSSKELSDVAVSLCSKRSMCEFPNSISINGLEIDLDSDEVSILNIVGGCVSPVFFKDIVQKLPKIDSELLASKIVLLTSKDILQIHTNLEASEIFKDHVDATHWVQTKIS